MRKLVLLINSILIASIALANVEDGVLTVALDPHYPPFEHYDEKLGKYVGVDVDLAQEIADRMGLELKLLPREFKDLFTALIEGEADLAISAITITDERKQLVIFSDSYYTSSQLIIIRTDSDIKSLDDLAEGTIAVQSGTTGEIMAKQLAKYVVSFTYMMDALVELENGNVDAAISDRDGGYHWLTDFRFKNLKDSGLYQSIERYGVAANKKSAPMINEVNQILKEIMEDGTFQEIKDRHF